MTRRIIQEKQRGLEVHIQVNGDQTIAYAGETVATALLSIDVNKLRTSPKSADPRGPFCFMGSCQECLIQIDGKPRLACQTLVTEGLSVKIELGHE